jgi:uncharacterized protein DUF5681
VSADDAVGYRKPPRHTRFRKGQSGNPRGRPKGAKNLKTDLAEELNEPITFREGRGIRTISKQRALVKSLVARALQGKPGAEGHVIGLIERVLGSDADSAEGEAPLSAEEEQVLALALARKAENPSGGGTGEAP